MYRQKLFNLLLIVAFILTSLPLTVLAAPPAPASVDLSAVTAVNILSPTTANPICGIPCEPVAIDFSVAVNSCGKIFWRVQIVSGTTIWAEHTGYRDQCPDNPTTFDVAIIVPCGIPNGRYDIVVSAKQIDVNPPDVWHTDRENRALIVDNVAPTVAFSPAVPAYIGPNCACLTGTATDATAGVCAVDLWIKNAAGQFLGPNGWQAAVYWWPAVDTAVAPAAPWSTWKLCLADVDAALRRLEQCKAYTVGVRATDCCLNASAVVTAPFIWDDQAPCLVIETPFEECVNEPICLVGYACDQDEGYCCAQCSGVKTVEVMVYDRTAGCWWDGSHWIVKESWGPAEVTFGPDCRWHWRFCLPPLVSGHTYCITVRATDNACNVTTVEWGCFLYDTHAPLVEICDLNDCYGPCAPEVTSVPGDGILCECLPEWLCVKAWEECEGCDPATLTVTLAIQRQNDGRWWNQTTKAWVAARVDNRAAQRDGRYCITTADLVPTLQDCVKYVVYARVVDCCGNVGEDVDWFKWDMSAPVVTINDIPDYINQDLDYVTGTAVDACCGVKAVWVWVEYGDPVVICRVLAKPTGPEDNPWATWVAKLCDWELECGYPYRVYAAAIDKACNWSENVYDEFVYDPRPTVCIWEPRTGICCDLLEEVPCFNDLDEICGIAADCGACCVVVAVQVAVKNLCTGEYWNGTAWVGQEVWLSVDICEDNCARWCFDLSDITFTDCCKYKVMARSQDNVGQWSDVKSFVFTWDTTPPQVTIVPMPADALPDNFAGTASDPCADCCIKSVWLAMKNNSTNKWWNGLFWVSSPCPIWFPVEFNKPLYGCCGLLSSDCNPMTWDWVTGVGDTDLGPFCLGCNYTVWAKAEDCAGNWTEECDWPSTTFTVCGPRIHSGVTWLSCGWNLISLPVIPFNASVEAVLGEILPNVKQVRTFINPGLQPKVWGPGPKTLTEIFAGQGYWVEMKQCDALHYIGYLNPPPPDPLPSYAVYNGWNLIGFKSHVAQTPLEYLGLDVALHAQAMYYWDPIFGIYRTPNQLWPTLGYWLAVNQDGVIYP